jgi:hypothetical protein
MVLFVQVGQSCVPVAHFWDSTDARCRWGPCALGGGEMEIDMNWKYELDIEIE